MASFDYLNKKKTGVVPYVLLLILAIVVLFFISNASFQQNRALRQSTELVTHTQEIINEINMLFGNYSSSQSAGIKYLVSRDSSYLSSIVGFSDKSKLSTKRLKRLTADNPKQQAALNSASNYSERLFTELKILDSTALEKLSESQLLSDKIKTIETQIDSLTTIQNRMITTEQNLLRQRKEAYKSEMTFTPINILYLALFALGILMFAFSKINSDRKRMAVTRRFLQNILENTDNMVNYLIPLRNGNEKIIDFEIKYVNSQVMTLTGQRATEMTGKKLTEIYPYAIRKGLVELLTEVLETGQTKTREINYEIEGAERWFVSTFAPMQDGITATSRDITADKKAEDHLKELNKKLENKNLELMRTDSFLQNMLGSIQYVISYFEAVRDSKGHIVDFKVNYTNDKITELTGHSPQEISGKLISEEYPFLFENGDFEIYKEVIETAEPVEFEKEYDLNQGHFHFCNEVLKLDDGVTIVAQDISLRKAAEKELEAATERLAIQNTVLSDAESAAGIGSFNYNLDTDTLTYSDNCYRMLGMFPEEQEPSLPLFR
ncbi:MAG: PAS domain-containing protein, partial [Pricia sp.]